MRMVHGSDLRHRAEGGRNVVLTPESEPRETRTVLARWNAISETTLMASRFGGHRSRRPGHVDQGMSRELVRASSFPVLRERGSAAERSSVGVHRVIKTPRKGLHRKADPTLEKNRGEVQVRRNEPDAEGASDER